MKQLSLSQDMIVDCFAGGGGASCGIEQALGHPVHIAINHDQQAVEMHKINHPYTHHFCEDIREVNPRDVEPGRRIRLLWASPDCKHFSKAKGGAPVSPRVRGLAWVVVRWAAIRKPDMIALENVEEFTTWGPLIKNAAGEMMPDPTRKGQTFNAFVNALRRLGYKVEWKELRACDYGAPTSRKRLFLIARCDGNPIVWPAPTHGKPGSIGLKPWRTAAEIIDWSIPCPSIFDRKKPLAEATMRRIARGVFKYVINNPKPFIVPIAHYNGSNPAHSIDEPLRTVTATPKGGHFALVEPFIVKVNHSQDEFRGQPLSEPLQTITAKHGYALAAPMIEVHHGNSNCTSPEAPLGAVLSREKHALVMAFLTKFRTGATGSDLNDPCPTITAGSTLDPKRPSGGGHTLGMVTSHLVKFRGSNIGQDVRTPLQTVTAGGLHFGEVRAFLIKYFGTDQDPRLEDPLHTITTKDRFAVVMVHGEAYAIVDIGLRMLAPHELFAAQGFPKDYIIDQTADGQKLPKHAQTRMCGNSVSPPMAEAIIRANLLQSIVYQQGEGLAA